MSSLRASNVLATSIAEDPLVQSIVGVVETSRRCQFDAEVLNAELQDMLNSEATNKILVLEGAESLQDAVEFRRAIQANRDRIITINRQLRSLLLRLNQAYRNVVVYVRQREDVKGLTQRHSDELVMVAVGAISERIELAENLLVETREAMTNLDKKTEMVDSWFKLHSQYVFLTMSHRNQHDREEPRTAGTTGRKLGSR
jgi:hypothetical protein